MEREKLINYVRLMLGGKKVHLEIDEDDISDLIDYSFAKIKPYIVDTKYITLPYARVIKIKERAEEELWVSIEDVMKVFRCDQAYYSSTERMFDFEILRMDRASVFKWVLGSYPITQTQEDIDFRYINGNLYLDSQSTYQGLITAEVVVTPTYEGLVDEHAKQWIQDYTLAQAKMVIGRIRSKFRPQGIPVELDGETLLGEGTNEIQTLESRLSELQFGPFYIIR